MTRFSPKNPEDTAHGRTVPDTVPELTLVEDDTVPELKLEDTAAQQRRGVAAPSPTLGYNPYDTGAAGEPTKAGPRASHPTPEGEPARKRTDLRKLSEWIQAQRRAEAARQEQQSGQDKAPGKAPGPPHRK